MTQQVTQDPFLLKLVVISLGIVLIAGFGLIMLLLMRRIGSLPTEAEAPAAVPDALNLTLPPGARVEALGLSAAELAVSIVEASAERVLILDRRTGTVRQTVTLVRAERAIAAPEITAPRTAAPKTGAQ